MPPTMADVARQAGVSKSTVSLALNNKPGISSALQENILQTAKTLGYQLPQRRPQKRPPVIPNITVVHCAGLEDSFQANLNDFYLAYFDGIQSYLRQKNINLTLIAGYHDGDPTHFGFHLLNNGKSSAIDGLILMGLGVQEHSQIVQQVQTQHIPAVAISRQWPHLAVSTVSQDHQQQARLAFEYLISLGHKTVAFVAKETDNRYNWFTWRLNCYRQLMTGLNGQVDEDLIALGLNGYQAATALLQRRPDVTAIFAINDPLAMDVMQAVKAMGLDIPGDISIIGVDDSVPSPAGFPGLTTVAFSRVEAGYLAAELLLKQIESNAISHFNIVVKSELVIRDSCAPPRA